MYGVPKYKEGFFLKYKKEVISVLCSFFAIFVVMTSSANNNLAFSAYIVIINNEEVGKVETKEQAQEALTIAKEMVEEELGYNPKLQLVLEYRGDNSRIEPVLSINKLASNMKEEIIFSLTDKKEEAYIVRIGDDFTVALRNTDDIKAVLSNAQGKYLADTSNIFIEIEKEANNGLVMSPKVIMLREEMLANRTFLTASSDSGQKAASTTEKKETAEKSPNNIVEVGFAEEIIIIKGYAYTSEIKSIKEATDLITKESESEKVYVVQKGDVPSIIAEKNNMSLRQLYSLNPGLEQNVSRIRVGDELIVMVPEPELSVTIKEEIVYKDSIPRETKYIDNAEKYVGSNTTIENGYDGEKEVTAVVTKINGNEIARDVINEKVLKEPKEKVVERGTKPLPAKRATGNFARPLASYKLSSPFGYRWGTFHQGVDMAAPSGTSIKASDGGVVIFAGWYGGYGYMIDIDHGGGKVTRYAHLSSIGVSQGQRVAQHEEIGKVGSTGNSTGPHLHFEIRFDGVPANPMRYL